MKGLTTFALSVAAIGLICAGLGNASCGGDQGDGDDDDQGDSGPPNQVCTGDAGALVYSGLAGEACQASAAQVPDTECDNAWQPGSAAGVESLCTTASPACPLSGCQVSTAAGSCEPLTNNPAAGPWNFRMRRIIIVAPPNLASETLQNTVVTNGVDMNEPQCGEIQTGAFSWLLSIDPTAKTMKTGGAPPCDITNPTKGTPGSWSCDPFTTGYCYVNKTVGTLAVAPVSVPIHQNCDNSWSTAAGAISTVNIPIYYQGNIIVLPISGGAMEGVKVSTDGNCIGEFNPAALNTDCSDNYLNCSKWKTDGSITGYITLETADSVHVDLLHESLCVILTNTAPADGGPGYGVCARNSDGTLAEKGDYCSTTGVAGSAGCQDSYWLAATFAASAVNINNGSNSGPDGGPNPDCLGGGSPGGDDSGTPIDDAGSDANDGATD